jgi:hypothetical protein
MGRTARRVLGTGSIVLLLALTAATAGAAPAAADAIKQPPSPPHASLPGSVEPTALRPADARGWSWRGFVELIVLAITCSAVVAFYSVTAGERGGTRVPARVRRR